MRRLLAATAALTMLASASAYAAPPVPPDSITTTEIKNGTILGQDIGDLTLNFAAATTVDRQGAAFNFGGERRVTIAQQRINLPGGRQPYSNEDPGAGYVEVLSPRGAAARLTSYQHGSNIITRGPKSGLFEFWLGTAGNGFPPILSVRGNDETDGAMITARNRTDTSGVALNYGFNNRPRVTLEDDNQTPGVRLGFDNPQPGGSLGFGLKLGDSGQVGGQMQDQLVISPGNEHGGILFSPASAFVFGDEPSDEVRFHGSRGSGAQGADPGALPALSASDVDTPAEVAAALNAQRQAINTLRQGLQQQGLVAGG